MRIDCPRRSYIPIYSPQNYINKQKRLFCTFTGIVFLFIFLRFFLISVLILFKYIGI